MLRVLQLWLIFWLYNVHTIPTWLKICIAENGITTPVATLFSLLYTVIHSNSHFSFFLWLCVTFGFYPNLSSFYRPHPFSYSCPAAEEIAATFVRIYFFLEQERRALFIWCWYTIRLCQYLFCIITGVYPELIYFMWGFVTPAFVIATHMFMFMFTL